MSNLKLKKRKYSDTTQEKLFYSFSEMEDDHKTIFFVPR